MVDEPIGLAEPGVVDAFDRQVATWLAAPFQALPASSRRLLDPFSGRRSTPSSTPWGPIPISFWYAHSCATRGSGRCSVCDVIAEAALEIARVGTVGVYAHPAPEKELTVLVAATENIAVRCGTSAGHLRGEVIPHSGVPVAAGFEKSTGLYVTTRDPFDVAAALRSWTPSAMDEAPSRPVLED